MDKYKRYYGLLLLLAVVIGTAYLSYNLISPQITASSNAAEELVSKQNEFEIAKRKKKTVEEKLKKLADANQKTQKKIFSPIETDLGDDSLFFVLYNDVLEMIHSNSVKIKKMDYVYNPADDPFVKHGKGAYFVCDINLELVSNYVNLGKLIQNIYQYPYYVKINEVQIEPYKKDKSILLTKFSVRLYAYTEPVIEGEETPVIPTKNKTKA